MSSKIVVSTEREDFGMLSIELVKTWEKPSKDFGYSVVISTKEGGPDISVEKTNVYNGVVFEYGNKKVIASIAFRSVVGVVKMLSSLSNQRR